MKCQVFCMILLSVSATSWQRARDCRQEGVEISRVTASKRHKKQHGCTKRYAGVVQGTISPWLCVFIAVATRFESVQFGVNFFNLSCRCLVLRPIRHRRFIIQCCNQSTLHHDRSQTWLWKISRCLRVTHNFHCLRLLLFANFSPGHKIFQL